MEGNEATISGAYIVYELCGDTDQAYSSDELKEYGFTLSPPDKMVSYNAVLAKLKELGK